MNMHASEAAQAARRAMERCDALAQISATAEGLTRVYLSSEHLRANRLVADWMEQAGMVTWQDAVGNICGRYEGVQEGARAVLLGSHLDTVRNAGRYDGMLGVVAAIEVVAWLHRHTIRLAQAIEVVGFADEEGTRFGITLLGSRGLTGDWPRSWLACEDADGISVAQALVNAGLDPARIGAAARAPEDFSAYLELHIEQGPVLEHDNLALGVVSAINGAQRLRCRFTGEAGHAGTVPMAHRRDALAAAAQWLLAVERAGGPELVATVGTLACEPGAVNVIPGEVTLSLDIRSPRDEVLESTLASLLAQASDIAARRGVQFACEPFYAIAATPCDSDLRRALGNVVAQIQGQAPVLASGAGHDAIAIAGRWPVGMLFVRCRGGISHHPDESVQEEDVALALRAFSQSVIAIAGDNVLERFNQAERVAAAAMIAPCVALPTWHEALVTTRPWASVTALRERAQSLMQTWTHADLHLALSAHPRIGERAQGKAREATLSRAEQSGVNSKDAALAQALAQANAQYEARFGHVFLIRASGRSGEAILGELRRRLANSDEQERAEALEQLRQITLLRFDGVFHTNG